MDKNIFCRVIVIEQDNNFYLKKDNDHGVFYDEVPIYTDITRALQIISKSNEYWTLYKSANSNLELTSALQATPDPPKVSKVFVHSTNSSNYNGDHDDELLIPCPFEHEYWKDSLDVTSLVLQLYYQGNNADFNVLPSDLADIRDPLRRKYTRAIPLDYNKLAKNFIWAPIDAIKQTLKMWCPSSIHLLIETR